MNHSKTGILKDHPSVVTAPESFTYLTREQVVVLNGDVLTDVDLSAMRRFHDARGSRTTIFLVRVDDPRAYGLVETEADGRLRAFREKPAADEKVAADKGDDKKDPADDKKDAKAGKKDPKAGGATKPAGKDRE